MTDIERDAADLAAALKGQRVALANMSSTVEEARELFRDNAPTGAFAGWASRRAGVVEASAELRRELAVYVATLRRLEKQLSE